MRSKSSKRCLCAGVGLSDKGFDAGDLVFVVCSLKECGPYRLSLVPPMLPVSGSSPEWSTN